MPTLLKLFHKIEREGTLPNSFCEDCIILIPKPNKDTTTTTKRELQVNLFNEHGCKNNKILANQIRHCFKKDHIT
jgi:hypothetical protein